MDSQTPFIPFQRDKHSQDKHSYVLPKLSRSSSNLPALPAPEFPLPPQELQLG